MDTLSPNEFLQKSTGCLIVDVRTPAEYALGHIDCAINIPIFTDEQRVVVGTIYKKQSKELAIEQGLDFVGPKLGDFIRTLKSELKKKKLSKQSTIYIYCWRGGMRSGSMAWLFRTAGFEVTVLRGGYKGFRSSFVDRIKSNYWKFITLGGPTGGGKTHILNELENLGEQVLNLEFIAKHRGSAFGVYGYEENQPTSEHFSNLIYSKLLTFDYNKPIWCEGESLSIGKVFMLKEFYELIHNSPFIYFDMSEDNRIDNILKDYGGCPKEVLIESFKNISKRLGYDNSKKAIELIENGDIRSAAMVALKYYDKGYNHSIMSKQIDIKYRFIAESIDYNHSAKELIKIKNKIYEDIRP